MTRRQIVCLEHIDATGLGNRSEGHPKLAIVITDEVLRSYAINGGFGNWLHMAESAILECTTLSCRGDREVALQRQVEAVETERNAHRHCICWQFIQCEAKGRKMPPSGG